MTRTVAGQVSGGEHETSDVVPEAITVTSENVEALLLASAGQAVASARSVIPP